MANFRHELFCMLCGCLVLLNLISVVTSVSLFRCNNGKENYFGGCDCLACWKGASCDEIDNQPPSFENPRQSVNIESEYKDNELIHVAIAEDSDNDLVCKGGSPCPCGEIEYNIVSGNDNGMFTIDPALGIVRLNGMQMINSNDKYELTLSASNKFGNSEPSKMVLEVIGNHWSNRYSAEAQHGYPDGTYYAEESHHRDKRAANAPSNVSFSLTKDANHNLITDIRPGQRISFILTIDFPEGETDMLVELFAPDNGSIVMMLCDVRVETVGTNLNFTGSKDVRLESKNSSIFYDWAIIDFGNVTNLNSNNDQHQIVIKYDAVTIQNENTVDDATYWVSAGAEYDNENQVWVGQASFTAKTDDTFNGDKPVFNFSGPSQIEIGSSAIFTVEMYITNPSIGLGFDAFAPLNNTDVMTICGVQIEGVGNNYLCGFDYMAVPSSLHADGEAKGNARGHLDIGVATNKGAWDTNNLMEDNLIKIQFVAKVWDDPNISLQKYWLGAALELGSDQIWCGQMEVEIIAKSTSSLPNPTMTTSYVGNVTEVSVSQPVVIEMEFVVTEGNGDLIIDVETPLDGSNNAKLQICALIFVSSGENIPCVAQDKVAEYSSRGNDKNFGDKAVLNMGVVTNIGSWGYFNTSLNDTKNTIVFRVLVKGVDHSSFTSSPNHDITVGFTSGGTRISMPSINIIRAAVNVLPEIMDTPAMNLKYKYSDGNVRVGQAVTMFYEISTLSGQTFPVFDMEFIAPNSSDSAMVSICRAEVTSIGKNIPCLSKTATNSKWQYVSQFNDNKNDRATLSLGSVCNFNVDGNSTEDIFIFSGIFQLQSHPDVINGANMYLSAGSMYTNKKIWVGQLSLTVDSSSYPLPVISKKPQIFINKIDTFASVDTPVGYPAKFEIVIQTVPGETLDLTVALATASTTLSFCNIRIKDTGNNLPCMDKTIKGVLTRDPATGMNNNAAVNLGPVTNVGDVATDSGNMTFDDNTILLEVTMQSSNNAVPGSIPFTVTASNTGVAILNTNLIVTASLTGIPQGVTNSSGIDFNVAAISIGDDDIYVSPGQAKRFYIDINMPMDATQRVTVKLMTPINSFGELEVFFIGLAEVGENLACLSREMTSDSYTSRGGPYYDIASLNIGYVCNTGLNKAEPTANRIRVEAYVRLLNNATLVDSATVTMNAAVNFNDQQIFISQMDLTVKMAFTDILMPNVTLTNGTAINVNVSATPIILGIGQIFTVPVILYIPAFTISKVQFDIDLPMSTSASMTYKNLKVVGSGQNLARYGYDEDYKITPVSSQNTTQMNKVFVDMGIVSNVGITHSLGTQVLNDDVIYLEVEVQLADSDTNVDDAEIWIGFGAKVATFIIISEHKVKVSRTGTEVPVFNLTANYDTDNSTSTYAEIGVTFSHADNSKAEFQNTILKFNMPPYLVYKEVSAINPTASQYTVNKISNNAIEINMGAFFFTDNLEMTVAFDVNATYQVPQGILTTTAVTGVEALANMIERTAPSFRNGSEEFTSGFRTVNGTYTTTSSSAGLACVPAILNLVTGCHFASSGEDIAGPENAIFTGTGWVPPVRNGKLGMLRYIQVYFGEKVSLTKIEYKHSKGLVDYVTKLKIRYSEDGLSFLEGEELSLGGANGEVSVSAAFQLMYLRLYITGTSTVNTEVGLNLQFTGCYISTTPGSVACPEAPKIPPLEYIRRSFVTDTTNVYVCDGSIGKKNTIETACYTSADGNKWTAMDPRVSCMVGHDDDVNGARLYAISNQYQYMTSDDKGVTWFVISDRRMPTVKASSTFTAAIKVPWNNDPLLSSGPDVAQFTQGTWTSKLVGLGTAGTFVNKFKWDTCCP